MGGIPMMAAGPVFHTKLCSLFGIDYPILQSGMSGVAGPDLAAEVIERTVQEARVLLLEVLPQPMQLHE
jgi:hypothetical protein